MIRMTPDSISCHGGADELENIKRMFILVEKMFGKDYSVVVTHRSTTYVEGKIVMLEPERKEPMKFDAAQAELLKVYLKKRDELSVKLLEVNKALTDLRTSKCTTKLFIIRHAVTHQLFTDEDDELMRDITAALRRYSTRLSKEIEELEV